MPRRSADREAVGSFTVCLNQPACSGGLWQGAAAMRLEGYVGQDVPQNRRGSSHQASVAVQPVPSARQARRGGAYPTAGPRRTEGGTPCAGCRGLQYRQYRQYTTGGKHRECRHCGTAHADRMKHDSHVKASQPASSQCNQPLLLLTRQCSRFRGRLLGAPSPASLGRPSCRPINRGRCLLVACCRCLLCCLGAVQGQVLQVERYRWRGDAFVLPLCTSQPRVYMKGFVHNVLLNKRNTGG